MKEKHVTNLETSKRLYKLLKEKGIEFDTVFWWSKRTGGYWRIFDNRVNVKFKKNEPNDCPAFTLSELKELARELLTKKSPYLNEDEKNFLRMKNERRICN